MQKYLIFFVNIACVFSLTGMFRIPAVKTNYAKSQMPKRAFSSHKDVNAMKGFLARARFQASLGDWQGVQGQATLFAHTHESIAQLERNKKIMTWVRNQLDGKADKIFTDASIFHYGIEAIELQLAFRRSGAIIISLGNSKNTQTEK